MLNVSLNANAIMTRASAYLAGYYAATVDLGGGDIAVEFEVRGVTYMDEVGVSKIELQERVFGGTFETIKTYYPSSYSNLVTYDDRTHMDSVEYEGIEGRYYRAIVTVYAEKDGGSDSRTITTPQVSAG